MMRQGSGSATITSSDGWNSIEFEPRGGDDEVLLRITARGQFWDRSDALDADTADLVEDFEMHLFQARVARAGILKLVNALGDWSENPRQMDIDLWSESLPRVAISIGSSDRFISSATKPVFALRYDDSRVEATFSFVVDQSCLKQFLDELRLGFL